MTAKRVLCALGLFLLCAGPTPGAVGDCKGDAGDEPADLTEYCIEKNELICVRRAERDRRVSARFRLVSSGLFAAPARRRRREGRGNLGLFVSWSMKVETPKEKPCHSMS